MILLFNRPMQTQDRRTLRIFCSFVYIGGICNGIRWPVVDFNFSQTAERIQSTGLFGKSQFRRLTLEIRSIERVEKKNHFPIIIILPEKLKYEQTCLVLFVNDGARTSNADKRIFK